MVRMLKRRGTLERNKTAGEILGFKYYKVCPDLKGESGISEPGPYVDIFGSGSKLRLQNGFLQ